MPLCRYMFKPEFDTIYNSMETDLRELCDDIEKLTGERYAVERITVRDTYGYWPFRRVKVIESYTVLTPTSYGEVQCINLMSSFCGGYTRNEAGAFLIGVRAEALRAAKEAPDVRP